MNVTSENNKGKELVFMASFVVWYKEVKWLNSNKKIKKKVENFALRIDTML